MIELVTDRNEADLARLKELAAKGLPGMTAEELTEWFEDSKGAYNHTDLNRVEAAVEYVRRRFADTGIVLETPVKKDWTSDMYPTRGEMDRYLDNVRKLRNAVAVPETVADVPASMDFLTIGEANDIERILLALDILISNMIQAYLYAGDLFVGEV